MYLRQKTLIAIGGLLTGLIVVLSVSLSSIISSGFARVEKKNAIDNVQRAIAVLHEELNLLEIIAHDWAHWDDLYEFVQDGNQEFIDTNLVDSGMENSELNFVAIVNTKGEAIYKTAFDLETSQTIPFPSSLTSHFALDRPLLKHETLDSSLQGILLLPDLIVFVASRPILTTNEEGPIRGTYAIGRYLNPAKIAEIEERTRLSLQFYRLDNPDLPSDLQSLYTQLNKDTTQNNENPAIVTQPLNEEKIAGYTIFRDIYDRPAVMLQVIMPREIYQQGQTSLRYLIISLLGVGIIFSVGTLILLERMVLLRLSCLSTEVEKIGVAHDLSQRVQLLGQDELTSLAQTINWMLESLEVSEKEVKQERERADSLLLNIFPEPIARALKYDRKAIAQHFDDVTILFADLVGFTELSARFSPIELVELLNEIFSQFDTLVDEFGLEKIKTIGDAYMVAAGLPIPRKDHADAMAKMALAMQDSLQKFHRQDIENLQIRIGINTGIVVAGVIGTKKFIYDLWGDAVNVASRMESLGKPTTIQVSATTYELLKDNYDLERRGHIWVKGKGLMTTYWLKNRKE